jgi:hypothetical protein
MPPTFDNPSQPYLEAALACYEMIQNLDVEDVDDVEGIERAIDLAIQRRHDPGPKEHLLRDVLRNGRFSARRSQARRRRLERRYASEQPQTTTGKRWVPGEFVTSNSPAASAAARELHEELSREARACGLHGPTILSAILAGETVCGAATAAGVSRSTANRTVKRLRQRARENGYAATA